MKFTSLPENDDELLKLCEVATFKSTGAGGQHVNKTESAVRLTYLPLGLSVVSREERSQYLNKLACIKKLRNKIKALNYRPKKRVPTKISKAQKEKNLKKKKQHSEKKALRKKVLD
jgi:protein subunit release factor B